MGWTYDDVLRDQIDEAIDIKIKELVTQDVVFSAMRDEIDNLRYYLELSQKECARFRESNQKLEWELGILRNSRFEKSSSLSKEEIRKINLDETTELIRNSLTGKGESK